eukprot:CAMPEP_0172161772 /NCGR_PEP_ID=MMETSP1050-20130122/6305_1 /TAXON_ID=233186 /ORGANISM="Cryptomonas curvata, Strain CCAP979/52" /LENGTH=142 /DNA_ID=CAMNT_0012831695 /DNA_START=112 /DNA_END=537 /DNA_ORIENTATION=-
MATVNVTLEFGGGLELLMGNVKEHKVRIDEGPSHVGQSGVTIKRVISWIKGNLIRERPDMFVAGETVRPGILVLVNDTDWELCGGTAYEVQEGDQLTFISTLHGGYRPGPARRPGLGWAARVVGWRLQRAGWGEEGGGRDAG